ncbi:hypothetical protein Ancab_028959 [Ancistrocladus abbreviatus]
MSKSVLEKDNGGQVETTHGVGGCRGRSEPAFAFLSKVAESDLEACAAELRNGGQVSSAESRDGCNFSDKTLESLQRTVGGVLVFSSCGRGPFAEK